jgi:putative transposase
MGYKLSLRDLAEMSLIRGFVFTYEAVRDWEAKLTPALAEDLRRSRKGKVGRSWYIDETYIRVHGGWKYLYRAIDRARRCSFVEGNRGWNTSRRMMNCT